MLEEHAAGALRTTHDRSGSLVNLVHFIDEAILCNIVLEFQLGTRVIEIYVVSNCTFLDVILSNKTEGEDTGCENVERAIVHPTQAPLLIVPHENCQRSEQVQNGEGCDEKITEALDQCPFSRLHQVVEACCVRVQDGHNYEEYEAE